MSNSITNRQMFFLIFIILSTFTTIDIPTSMAQTAGRSSWIPIIIASIISGVSVIIITKLNNMHMNKVFFDYSQQIIGKFFTYTISIYYIIYYLLIGVYLKLKLVGILNSNFLHNTPGFVFLLFGVPLFAYVAHKGITNMARLFEIYGLLFLVVTIGICVAMIFDGTKFNVLPFFNVNEVKGYSKAMKELIVPFGGIEILLIVPFTAKNKKAPLIAFLTLLFIGIFYILIVESTMMMLGINNTILLNDSFIEAIKDTDVPVIERLDILYLTIGLSSLFSGMIIVFGGVIEFACKILPKVKRHILVISIAVIFYIVCLFGLKIKDINKFYGNFVFYLVIISSFIIPITTFIIAKVKKSTQE